MKTADHNRNCVPVIWFSLFLFVIFFPLSAFPRERICFERMWPELQQPGIFLILMTSLLANPEMCMWRINNHRIQKFSPDETFITKWEVRVPGTGSSGFNRDSADQIGNVYVADSYKHPHSEIQSGRTFITKWEVMVPGTGSSIIHMK
ncbi:MAG: hypothetical protein R2941_07715 [Desulfobacterales bacterium]